MSEFLEINRANQERAPRHLQEIRKQAVTELVNHKSITIPYNPKTLGDNLILYSAHFLVLEKFCQKHEIPFDRTNPPIRFSEGEKDHGYSIYSLRHSSISALNPVMQEPHQYNRDIRVLSHLLGVPIEENELGTIPLPFKTNRGPLEAFDKGLVGQHARKIEKDLGKKKNIVIVQAGSAPDKRFSDQQVAQLVEETKKNFPESSITVLTDKKITDQSLDDPLAYGADNVLNTTDINEIGGIFTAKNSLIISTDTFLAWYAAGCQALGNNGKLPSHTLAVLYTVASIYRWGIPGAEIIESPASRYCEKNSYGMVSPVAYQDFWNKTNTAGLISKNDILLVKERIKILARQLQTQRKAS